MRDRMESNKKVIIFFCLFLCGCILPMTTFSREFIGPAYSVKVERMIDDFGKKLAQKNEMKFLRSGVGAIVNSNLTAWDLSLTSNKNWTIEQARPIIVSMIKEFLNLVLDNPDIENYIKKISSNRPSFNSELSPRRIGFKLAFWDENVDRPLPPYLAQIKVMEGKIFYFYANPKDQSLQQPPVVETFEEAFALIEKK